MIIRSQTHGPEDILEPEPVTRDQLCLAHSPSYADGVLSTQEPNSFGNRSAQVAASLPYTSGAMLAAARCALDNGFGAVAPCSGFHHAGHRFGGGFCTFNGLMVTACTLLKEARVQRIAILDLDMHHGNGTVDIIDHLGLHDRIQHHTHEPPANQAAAWQSKLDNTVHQLCQGCDLLLYQAGADSHIDEPMGGYQRLADGSIRPVLDLQLRSQTMIALLQWFNASGLTQTAVKVRVATLHSLSLERKKKRA